MKERICVCDFGGCEGVRVGANRPQNFSQLLRLTSFKKKRDVIMWKQIQRKIDDVKVDCII